MKNKNIYDKNSTIVMEDYGALAEIAQKLLDNGYQIRITKTDIFYNLDFEFYDPEIIPDCFARLHETYIPEYDKSVFMLDGEEIEFVEDKEEND